MSDWKSCDNCVDIGCRNYMSEMDFLHGSICGDWKPIQCPYCGGALSEIREHKGKKYRHCYACHFEFFEEE